MEKEKRWSKKVVFGQECKDYKKEWDSSHKRISLEICTCATHESVPLSKKILATQHNKQTEPTPGKYTDIRFTTEMMTIYHLYCQNYKVHMLLHNYAASIMISIMILYVNGFFFHYI